MPSTGPKVLGPALRRAVATTVRTAVRFAKAGETLQMLDGRVVELKPDILMIADERTLLGMARRDGRRGFRHQ